MEWTPQLVWFCVGMVLLVAEIIIPGIILLFFGLGAWLVALMCFLGVLPETSYQLIVFAISSVIFLFAFRKWLKAQFSGHVYDEQQPEVDLDEFTGKIVRVVEAVNAKSQTGKVEFKGARWSVISSGNHAVGSQVKIIGLDGIKLIIE